MTELENVQIFRDTQKQIAEKYSANGIEAHYYNGLPDILPSADLTPIQMVHGGTVSTGYADADEMTVAILNFADALQSGGLVEVGAYTQEENICRCSNLYPVLASGTSQANYYKPNMDDLRVRQNEVYTDRIIYARNVTVFKDDVTYSEVAPKQLDVITCPAPSAYLAMHEAVAIYSKRINQIILSAIENGVDCIVLGAWGCGAFAQKPELVALAFAHVLNSYSGYFKKVVFAMKPTTDVGTDDMYNMFKTTLNRFYKGRVIE